MDWVTKWLLRTIAVWVTAQLVPGVRMESFWTAVVVAVVLGLLNLVVKPILVVLTLPITILTLGLFTVVINTVIIWVAAEVVPGFEIVTIWAALWFGLVLGVVNWVLGRLGK